MSERAPPAPDGRGEPRPLRRPTWLLELLGLLVLAIFALATGLVERYLAATDAMQLATIALLVALTVAHEACHLLGARSAGFAATVDLVPPRVYTLDAWGTRREGIVLAVAPFVLLNLVGLPLWFLASDPMLALAGHVIVVVNTAVSVADIYVVLALLRLPEGSLTVVVRIDDGLREYVAEPETRDPER